MWFHEFLHFFSSHSHSSSSLQFTPSLHKCRSSFFYPLFPSQLPLTAFILFLPILPFNFNADSPSSLVPTTLSLPSAPTRAEETIPFALSIPLPTPKPTRNWKKRPLKIGVLGLRTTIIQAASSISNRLPDGEASSLSLRCWLRSRGSVCARAAFSQWSCVARLPSLLSPSFSWDEINHRDQFGTYAVNIFLLV